MVMSGLVQIGLAPFGCKSKGVFELLPSKTSLQNTMELFRVDIQRRFFCLRAGDKFR